MNLNYIILKEYFLKYDLEIEILGKKDNPFVVNLETGEVLNLSIYKTGVCFRINIDDKGYFIKWSNLLTEKKFNFKYWIENSSKKKIFLFEFDNQYFKRYNIKNNKYIPIFTEDLRDAYYAFRIVSALNFQRTMHLKGVNLNIIRKWIKPTKIS